MCHVSREFQANIFFFKSGSSSLDNLNSELTNSKMLRSSSLDVLIFVFLNI